MLSSLQKIMNIYDEQNEKKKIVTHHNIYPLRHNYS